MLHNTRQTLMMSLNAVHADQKLHLSLQVVVAIAITIAAHMNQSVPIDAA